MLSQISSLHEFIRVCDEESSSVSDTVEVEKVNLKELNDHDEQEYDLNGIEVHDEQYDSISIFEQTLLNNIITRELSMQICLK